MRFREDVCAELVHIMWTNSAHTSTTNLKVSTVFKNFNDSNLINNSFLFFVRFFGVKLPGDDLKMIKKMSEY